MPNFGIAIGHDAEIGDIDDFVPYQPLTPGLQWTRSTPTADGVIKEAPFIRFMFEILSETQYQAMLTQAGVYSFDTRDVTLYAQDENYEWKLLRGIAIKPLNEGRRGFHLRNVPLLVINVREDA